MRALSARQAVTCEQATGPRCKCRCGGLLHGKGRAVDVTALPEEDAHHANPPKRRKTAAQRREELGQQVLPW